MSTLHVQSGEGLAHLGDVVDADNHLAFDRFGQLGHAGVLVEAEVHAVAFRAVVYKPINYET